MIRLLKKIIKIGNVVFNSYYIICRAQGFLQLSVKQIECSLACSVLQSTGIRVSTVRLVSQFVGINGSNSSQSNLIFGVLQGSVLDPILCLLYTSPLSDIIRRHDRNFHADNCRVYFSFNTVSSVRVLLLLRESKPAYKILQLGCTWTNLNLMVIRLSFCRIEGTALAPYGVEDYF